MKDKIEIVIDGNKFEALHRQFKTGSQGFGFYSKVEIDGKKHQVSLNIIELK